MRNRYDADQLERIREEMVALRQQLARLAISIAHTEEQIASTLEKAARSRPPRDAVRLLAKANAARQFAREERGWAAKYDGLPPGDEDDRTSDRTVITLAPAASQ